MVNCDNTDGDDAGSSSGTSGGSGATPGITVTEGTTTFSENGGSGSFTVKLNTEPDGDVVIDVSSGDTGEVTVDKSSLDFTPSNWSTAQTVTLTGVDDSTVDGDQSVTITNTINTTSTTDSTGYGGATVSNVTSTVQDDDSPGVTVTEGTTTFSENSGSGSFNVVLNTEPDGDVVIDVSSGDTGEVTVDKSSLTFTSSNWSMAQTVTLTGVDDHVEDGSQSVTITNSINTTSTNDSTGYSSVTVSNVNVTVTQLVISGEVASHTVGGVSYKMIGVEGKSFYTEMDDSGTATVSSAYRIAETEVTYELWYAVYDWAVNGTGSATGEGQYTFANAGREGNDGTIGAAPTAAKNEPVTEINWRDAMVWMNAFTEYYNAQNGTSLKPVYYTDSSYTTPIRSVDNTGSVCTTAGCQDKPYIYAATSGNTSMDNNTADGFRLPTMDEWELAARYIDDANGDGDIKDAGEYYPGDYASGADDAYNQTASSDYDGDGDSESTGNMAVYSGNSGSSTAAVKSKSPNALGLYDMSGNIWEWNFDWRAVDDSRDYRGGSYSLTALSTQVGNFYSGSPYGAVSTIGFRPVRTP